VLERLNKLKSEFLIRISHQFRTALVGIQGFSELIRDSERLDLAEVKAFASDIHTDAKRLDRAFNQMLELDRMEAGRTILQTAQVDINMLILEVVEAARDENAEHVLAVRLDPSAPPLQCDRGLISQVLDILLSNATRYSAAGTEVAVVTQVDADFVKVSVKDHGPGMPADFDSGLFVGNGLGLPIARQILEMHGGRLWFDSAAGLGSEFHFTLPLHVRTSVNGRAAARNQSRNAHPAPSILSKSS